MRAREFLTLLESEVTLNPAKLTKDIARFDRFIANIASGKPLYLKDGTPVIIKNTEAQRLQDLFDQGKFSGPISLLGADQKPYSLGSFLKTKEYGGQSVPPGADTAEVPVAGIKPGQVFQHGNPEKEQDLTAELAIELGAFPAIQLGQKIISNAHLDSQGATGAAVKEIARQIEAGQVPAVPELSKGELNNIQNYGFEYLGVLSLIKGVADFPNADAFYEHLGINPSEMILYFPGSSSNPVADSYALVNKKTENTIFISSKGGKGGGAPSSVTALKIPEKMKKMIGKDPAITFIDMLQNNAKPAWIQPFYAANWMEQNYPGSMGKLGKFLPFSDELLLYLSTILKSQKEGVPESLEQIPEEFRPLYSLVQSSVNSTAPLFFVLRYYVKDLIHAAVRRGVIPNFSERMIELLGQNFVLLKTTMDKGQFVTHVRWPSKVGGTVTFEHKDPAPKWDSAMTWKLS